MLHKKQLTLLSAAFLALAASQPAAATSWFDFAQSAAATGIAGTDFSDTTSLATVRVACPAAGYLAAQGSAQIQLQPVAAQNYVQAGISITRDNAAPYAADPNHFNSIVLNTNNNVNAAVPAFIQRIDACAAGQIVNYRLVVWRESAGAGSVGFQPRLVVQFFSNRI